MKHPIFNYSNLSKYLWIERSDIKFFTVCMPTCVVTLTNGERIKIKAEDLINRLNSDRQERAKQKSKNYELIERPYWYQINNRLSGEKYRLDPELKTVKCSCDDYGNMSRMLGDKVLCKHGYMLLQYLGFTDLEQPEYMELVRDCYIEAEAQKVAEENELKHLGYYSSQWG